MIIAIDFDGTIADTNAEKAAWIERHLGLRLPPCKCNRTDCLPLVGARDYARMADELYGREATMRTAEVPGALMALRTVAGIGDLFVVTARSVERMEFAREWLESRGLLVWGLRTCEGSTKAAVCAEVRAGVLVDDDLRHLRELADASCRPILFQPGRAGPTGCEPGIARCQSWPAVVRELELLCRRMSA
jgi:hypothetical protein